MNTPANLTTEDLRAIRADLKRENPRWEDALTAAELQAMADDAVEGCAPGCSPDALRRAVVRTAAMVCAEVAVGEE